MQKTDADKILDRILTVDNVLKDIQLVLRDYFVAEVLLEDGYVSLKFVGDKKFRLYLEEVNGK
ncbi:MAG: hypothetical protein K2I30_03515 [Clostridia bacterium]|nr:hypothetical protein [Clostridia bacterium]